APASRFLYEEHPRGDVPAAKPQLEVPVDPATGNISKIQRRRSRPPNAMRPDDDLFHEIEICGRISLTLTEGEAGGDQRTGQIRDTAHEDPLTVQPGSTAAC